MKLFLLVLFLISINQLFGQTPQTKDIIFEGYIFSEDSVPYGDVHLINYRTLKIVTTNDDGYFRTYLQEGDSLMINHLSLAPKRIKANTNPAKENAFYVPYRTFSINEVVSNEYLQEMKNLEKTTKIMQTQSAQSQASEPDLFPLRTNTYEYEPVNYGLTTTAGQLMKLFKKKKKQQ